LVSSEIKSVFEENIIKTEITPTSLLKFNG